MSIGSIRTVGFRNLIDNEIQTDSSSVFLIGENGQGKTNFLEAVYFCSYASSFRSVKDADVVKNGEKDCAVNAHLTDSSFDLVSARIENGKKIVLMDGKRVEDRKTLLSTIAPIVFCHDDMDFVSGTPERRRWFFDQSLCIYDSEYVDELRKYRKILKTRNSILKERKVNMLEFLDTQLVESGLKLIHKRKIAVEFFSEVFLPLYESVSGIGGVSVRYGSSWKNDDRVEILKFIEEKRESELDFGSTLSGPHRDRYSFIRFGTEYAGKASTGQRRLLALLLRATQALRYAHNTGHKPILLLDDVLLELDPEKRKRFLSVLPDYDQAFFTFLPEEPYERYAKNDTIVYRVEAGRIHT
ncbi:MAG: DNA replication and repair protein RecF [Treponemataceae bacterium]